MIGDHGGWEASGLDDAGAVQERHTTLSEVRVTVGVLHVHQFLVVQEQAEHTRTHQSDELVQGVTQIALYEDLDTTRVRVNDRISGG
ncbi:hypothetical protein D9M71_840320 [compost metagenome]